MKLKTTLLAALGCLFALATSCKDPDDNNKTQYATNKAGERLVEKIIDDSDTICFEYNSDGTLKTIKGYEGNRIFSFEKRNNTLFMKDIDGNDIEETSFDLNANGLIILDRGWNGKYNYRLTYDESGKYLHNVFDGDKLIWTFQWEDGNIANKEVTYIPTQSHPSNIDWCAYFQTWRIQKNEENEDLVEVPSISSFWGFSEGYLGNKCKGLPAKDENWGTYTYDYTEDGFISAIYTSNEWRKREIHVTYLKK